MKKEHKKKNFEDERGFIQDIMVDGKFEHVTLISSKKDIVRGNHYHKKTVQYVFVLDGRLEYYYETKDGQKGMVELEKGDFIETPILEKHAIKTVEDTDMIVLTHGPRGGDNYESDTYRLDEPLIKA